MIPKHCFKVHIKVPMDRHDLKAIGVVNDGTCPDGSAGLQNQDHESNDEVSCREASIKLPEIGRNDLISSNDCTIENLDGLRRQSSVISTIQESVLEKEHCAKGTFTEVTCCDGLEGKGNLLQDEASALSPEGDASTMKISMKSDINSDNGQPLDRENCGLENGRVGGWSNAGESGLKSVMQATSHEKQYKPESSSSNTTHIALPASSNDSYQVPSVDAKACVHSKTCAMETSICTDFKNNLKESGVQVSTIGIEAKDSKDELDLTICQPRKQQNVDKASDIVHFILSDGNRVVGMTSDHNSLAAEDVDLRNPVLLERKVAEVLNKDKVQLFYELDDALEVAQRVAREVEREVGTFGEVSGSSSSAQEEIGVEIQIRPVDLADSNKKDCLTETGSRIQLSIEQDNCDGVCSIKAVVNPDMSARNKGLYLEVEGPSHGVGPKMFGSDYGLHGQESSYVTEKPEDVATSDKTNLFRIDLNENMLPNEEEYPNHSVNLTTSCVIKPIPAVAQSGIPISLGIAQSQGEGELGGWKGSGASAFRLISCSNICNRRKSLSTNDNDDSLEQFLVKDIDLNVAAAGVDFDMALLPEKCVKARSSIASEESSISYTRARRSHIDLNFASENDDSYHQLSTPASLYGSSVRDFDLNDNPKHMDACIEAHQPGQVTQALRNTASHDNSEVSFIGVPGQLDFRSVGTKYLTGFSTLCGFTNDYSKPFQVPSPNTLFPSNEQKQVVHPLQHKTYTRPLPSPPHAFVYGNRFCIDSTNSPSSAVYPPSFLPYITDPHGTSVIPQILGSRALSALSGISHIMSVSGGPGALSAFPSTPHMFSVPGGPGPSDITVIKPIFGLNGIASSSEKGSRVENTRELFIPVSDSTLEGPIKSFQPVAFSITPMKRREPDGGFDTHQLSYRQATSWH